MADRWKPRFARSSPRPLRRSRASRSISPKRSGAAPRRSAASTWLSILTKRSDSPTSNDDRSRHERDLGTHAATSALGREVLGCGAAASDALYHHNQPGRDPLRHCRHADGTTTRELQDHRGRHLLGRLRRTRFALHRQRRRAICADRRGSTCCWYADRGLRCAHRGDNRLGRVPDCDPRHDRFRGMWHRHHRSVADANDVRPRNRSTSPRLDQPYRLLPLEQVEQRPYRPALLARQIRIGVHQLLSRVPCRW